MSGERCLTGSSFFGRPAALFRRQRYAICKPARRCSSVRFDFRGFASPSAVVFPSGLEVCNISRADKHESQ